MQRSVWYRLVGIAVIVLQPEKRQVTSVPETLPEIWTLQQKLSLPCPGICHSNCVRGAPSKAVLS